MTRLLASPMIEHIGWALLHSLWQITLISLVIVFLRLVFRQPRIRHALGMLALLASVAWPVIGFVQSLPEQERRVSQPTAAAAAPALERTSAPAPQSHTGGPLVVSVPTPPAKSVSPVLSWRSILNQSAPWAAGFWMAGLFLLLLRHAGALLVLHRLRRKAVHAATPALQAVFDHLKLRLGVHRAAGLLISAKVITPMIIGTLRPLVLVPASLATGLSPAELEALLAHELAHLRRWDDVVNLIQCAIETLLFYHPSVWWMGRKVRQERELCCDDLAVQRGVEACTLAQALGRLALWQADAPQPVLAASGQGPVVHRIRRLLQPATPKQGVSAWPLLLVLLAALPFSPIHPSQAEEKARPGAFRGRILDRHGAVLAESSATSPRTYPGKALAAHVIGYTGNAGYTDANRKALVGRTGIEQSSDDTLSQGHDVTLTLDAGLQRTVEEILAAKASGGGACVVMDPRTGEVLALASWPTFDLNQFTGGIGREHYEELKNDPRVPLLGRAFQGNYFPGSMFKLVTAIGALRSGAIDEKTIFNGDSSFQIGDRTFHNWAKDSEGPLDVVGAIRCSCNTWFYQAALKAGSAPVIDTALGLGFGRPTGLPLGGEAKGFVPTEAFYQQRYGHAINPGILASISIGQIAEASPIQIAAATCAIANGGTVWQPRLTTDQAAWTESSQLQVEAHQLEPVRQGMRAAVNDKNGVAGKARIEGVEVAGITGSMQWKIHDDSRKNRWLAGFTGFAPYDNPRVVVTIVYEGQPGERVSGGSTVAPLARDIIQAALRQAPQQPLKTSSRYVDPLSVRFNEAWFASATMTKHISAKDGETRFFLPPPQAGSAPGKSRYECVLVLRKDFAQLLEGNATLTGGSHVIVEKKDADGKIVSGKVRRIEESPLSINADQVLIIKPEDWPALWHAKLRAALPPSRRPATDVSPPSTPSRSSQAAVQRLPARFQPSSYKPETILMADGTTRGFVRGTFPWAPPLEEVPSAVTFMPALQPSRWIQKETPPPFVTPQDLKDESDDLSPQVQDVELYRRAQSPSVLPEPTRVDLHLPDLSPGLLDPLRSGSGSIFPPLPKTLDAVADPLMSTPPPLRGVLENQFRKREEDKQQTEERQPQEQRTSDAFRHRNRAENTATPSSTSPRPAPRA